jgi:hypothetical protein
MNSIATVKIQLSFAFILMLSAVPVLSEESIEGLGKLFIDPEQREKLEAVRRGTYNAEAEKESRLSNIRVNGLMLRSDGENVVWINGESTLGGKEIQGLSVNPSSVDTESYKVQINVDGKRVNIKPGQNWSEGTGTIKDNY